MSQFNYNDYQKTMAAASANSAPLQKVGFFKLKDDGDEALVRINVSSLDDLMFATVHTLNAGGKWMRVSCLNPIGQYSAQCPLCSAAESDTSISKASKKVYIPMLVAYKDKATGTFSNPVPVIWERAAGFSKELATKIRDYGDLKNILFKVTRNGAAGYLQTTYSLDYAVPTIFKPELVPADFSAFNNFNIAKHSYWEKTADEIAAFLRTGEFPQAQQAVQAAPVQATPVQAAQPTFGGYTAAATTGPVDTPPWVAPQAPVQQAPVREAVSQPEQVQKDNSRPTRTFGTYSF